MELECERLARESRLFPCIGNIQMKSIVGGKGIPFLPGLPSLKDRQIVQLKIFLPPSSCCTETEY